MIDEPVALWTSLDSVVRSLGPGVTAQSLSGVFGRWEDVVGDHVAAHARPASLDDGRLVVLVDQPAWATQLRYLEHDLLDRLAGAVGVGTVTAIEVRVRRG